VDGPNWGPLKSPGIAGKPLVVPALGAGGVGLYRFVATSGSAISGPVMFTLALHFCGF